MELTEHFTARANDSHAALVIDNRKPCYCHRQDLSKYAHKGLA